MSEQAVTVQLACGCWRDNIPPNKFTASCLNHIRLGMQPIRQQLTHEWHTRCKDCTYSRWFGMDEQAARSAARRHDLLEVSHWVDVAYQQRHGGVTIDTSPTHTTDPLF